MRKRIVVLAAVTAMMLPGLAAHAAVALPRLNIDASQTTVSGLSSGGFMANQLGYAYSSTFHGVGVFAGGPYMCAGHSNYTACMYNASISSQMLNTMQADINNWSSTAIDDKASVAQQKIYLFVGNSDTTVGPNPMNAVQTQYTANGVAVANLDYVKRASTAHTFPTDFDGTGNNNCNSASSPYISNCGYDGAKAALTRFYGPLNARNDTPAAANYIEFDQSAFTSNPGMAPTGWVYVPSACAGGATACRLHVALHGCLQNYATVGDKFLKNTGYTRWADTNRIVVLFPQTRVDNTQRPTSASGSLPNGNGCWDWIGWYGSNFAQRAGSQQVAIKAMVDQLASGSTGPGTLPAPTGVTLSAATSSSMTLAWAAVSGASGYNVYRNGSKATASPVAATTFTDTGLAPGTSYSWTVAALDDSGLEGSPSTPISGSTTGGTATTCFTSSNYAHVSAGRAHVVMWLAYANGSNQYMGLWNIFFSTTLKHTGPGYYVVGSCP
ncbi:PHB depolymerase family esterase [Variovorax robiniae]|uniref:PHB depolymerase family esterase n=1 Tax=Variovorax robiniae TaxID=1836199 RepID=A0ABU8X394_9BURK